MIDHKRIKRNLNNFSFPRLSGTKRENKIFEIIRKKLENLGLSFKIQSFSFTKFYPKVYQKITFFLTLWCLWVIFFSLNLIFIITNLVIIAFIFLPLVFITRKPSEIRLGKEYSSKNIYLNYSNNQDNSLINKKQENNLFLIAHLDSKGQTLPMLLRVVNVRVWIYSLIFSIFLITLKNILFPNLFFFQLLSLIPLVLNSIATGLVIVNFSINNSPGAIDDASGVTILIEILNYLMENNIKIENYNLWFLFTGCEESGTMGIRNFHKIIKDFNKNNTKFINFDSVAQQIDIWGPVSNSVRERQFFKEFMKLTEKDSLIFHFKPFILATIRSDAYFLKTKGFRGYSFGDTSVYRYIHSTKDSVDKVNENVLSKTCKIIVNFLNRLDKL